MNNDTKVIGGVILGTLAIVVAGIVFLTKSQPASIQKADNTLLIRADSYKIAPASSKVTMVEFSDFQCPACGAYHPLVKQVLSDFKNDLTFVYRNFPLTQHKNAVPAALAAEAAGNQGKYWEMSDLIFANQKDWSNLDNPSDKFSEYAKSLNLDLVKFKKDMALDTLKQKIDRDVSDGFALKIDSTPTFYLDGIKLSNPGSYDQLKKLIQDAINKAPLVQGASEEIHNHADFKVFLNGIAFDFSKAKYQATKDKELNPDIHLHDNNGNLMHIHKTGVTLRMFFQSLGFVFPETSGTKTLKLFVNGKENGELLDYQPQDLDRIVISFGENSTGTIQKELAAVADTACIYSLKCPERGKPPTEECVGGLGTGCKD